MHDQAGTVEAPGDGDGSNRIREIARTFTDAIVDDDAFRNLSTAIATFQRLNVPLYGKYWDALGDKEIPFLPIGAFKEEVVICGTATDAERVFISSGTGEKGRSRHYVRDASVYEKSYLTHFIRLFGTGPFTIVAHLPGYADLGEQSSLVYMANGLIDRLGDRGSGFFLEDSSVLTRAIEHSQKSHSRLVLLGAAFGLLNLLERGSWTLPSTATLIETGGMKTKRRETDRETLHRTLARGFGVDRKNIWSEYGMCELLSQCYARGDGAFQSPPWVRFEIRDIEYPTRPAAAGEAGLMAIMDLANLYSVSAILTEDVGLREGSGFRLLGRLTGADLRGCNLLLERMGSREPVPTLPPRAHS